MSRTRAPAATARAPRRPEGRHLLASTPRALGAKAVVLGAVALSVLTVVWSPPPAHAHPGWDARLPPGASVVAEARDGRVLDLYLELPAWFLAPGADTGGQGTPPDARPIDEAWLGAFTMLETTAHADEGVRAVRPWAVDPSAPAEGWKPLVAFLPPAPPLPVRPREGAGLALPPLHPTGGAPSVGKGLDAPGGGPGALTGKVVYLSQAHGWYWSTTLDRWAAQRGNNHGIVEDMVNAEAANHFLVHYLRNAGATVFTVRESDPNPERVVVDAEPGGVTAAEPTAASGVYSEHPSGSQAFSDGVYAGFGVGGVPYSSGTNPFTLGGERVTTTVAGEATTYARWAPSIPVAGLYAVYVSYTQDSSRAPDAHYVVRHAGGAAHVRLDQRRFGSTWVSLGTFYFDAGATPERGAVELHNDSAIEGATLALDAVRFGGGRGLISRGTGSGQATSPTTGRPRWESAARYHTQYAGAPPAVYDIADSDKQDDVSSRSRFASWMNEEGHDAVYVSWHTNAPDPGRGTSTWVYGPNSPDGQYIFTGTEGSDDLAAALHTEIVNDIRAAFDPSWKDRGLLSAWFGELNPTHNPEMPAALVEAAFHATAADAEWLKEPRFRQVLARAFYQGIVRYFAERDGVPVELAPDAPEAVALRHLPGGDDALARAEVSWDAPVVDGEGLGGDAATSYIVYRSVDGRAFDAGTSVEGGATSLVLDDVPRGAPLFVRVTARNAGGESFPSVTVGAVPPCRGGQTRALVVHGFYRFDKWSLPVEDLSPWALADIARLRPERMNTFDGTVAHVLAFAALGVPVDGVEAVAVSRSPEALTGYDVLWWALGEESTVDATFSAAERAALDGWWAQGDDGGRPRLLAADGAEIGWDLEAKGEAEEALWLHSTFRAAYSADDGAAHLAQPSLDAPAAMVDALGELTATPLAFGDASKGPYDVAYPDVFVPLGDGLAFLEYVGADAAEGAAAVWHPAAQGGPASALFGFPLDACLSQDATEAAIRAVLEAAAVESPLAGGCQPPSPSPDAAPDTGPELGPELGPEPMPEPVPEAVADVGAGSEPGWAGRRGLASTAMAETRTLDEGCGGTRPGGGAPAWCASVLGLATLAWRRRRRRRQLGV